MAGMRRFRPHRHGTDRRGVEGPPGKRPFWNGWGGTGLGLAAGRPQPLLNRRSVADQWACSSAFAFDLAPGTHMRQIARMDSGFITRSIVADGEERRYRSTSRMTTTPTARGRSSSSSTGAGEGGRDALLRQPSTSWARHSPKCRQVPGLVVFPQVRLPAGLADP